MRQGLQLLDARACVRTDGTGQHGQLAQAWHRRFVVRVGSGREVGKRRKGSVAFGGEQGRPVQLAFLGRWRRGPLRQHGVGQAGQFLQAGENLHRSDRAVHTR
ncbi:hypothetical protein D3C81_405550 [compost metagenome]